MLVNKMTVTESHDESDYYNCQLRLQMAIKCNALLRVVDGRRLTDGFVFPGAPTYDHNQFPSPFLREAYVRISGICPIYS